MPLRIFTSGGADAATALIRAILERHKYQYEVHDVAADGAALNRYGKHCPGMELALLPVLYVRKGVVWIADDMPELEKTGELLVQLKAARTETLARDEYKWGVLYLRGDAAIERDPLAALEWLRRSAEHGDRRGQCALATLLQTGEGGVADADGARRWFEAAAAQGCSTARLALGEELLRDARAALTRRKDLAAAGERRRRRRRALCGGGGGRQRARPRVARAPPSFAISLARRRRRAGAAAGAPAAASPDGAGGFGGGDEFDTPLTPVHESARLESMYREAAAGGSADGQFALAHLLNAGRLPPLEGATLEGEPLALVRSAAEAGHAPAAHARLRAAAGGPKEAKEAVKWWEAAAAAGHPPAQAALAQAVAEGGYGGLKADAARARSLYEAAAARGEAAALIGLGDLHYGGRGCAKDKLVAYAYYCHAARRGSTRGRAEVRALRMELSAPELRRAKPLEALVGATLGEGKNLYKVAKEAYAAGVAAAPRDETRLRWAVAIFERCARKGEVKALVALAKLHLEGAGVPPSEGKATSLLQRAAQLGSAAAAWGLARLYWEKHHELLKVRTREITSARDHTPHSPTTT